MHLFVNLRKGIAETLVLTGLVKRGLRVSRALLTGLAKRDDLLGLERGAEAVERTKLLVEHSS